MLSHVYVIAIFINFTEMNRQITGKLGQAPFSESPQLKLALPEEIEN